MSVLNRMISTLHTLTHSRAAQDDVAEEMRFHAEQHAAELESQGVPPAEAQRRARAALGMHARNGGERHREMVGLRLFDEVRADVRYGLRGLWRNKSFALIAILSMALGIGAATAMFSVVYAVLLDVYPYADANRTVNPMLHDSSVAEGSTSFTLNSTQYEVYRHAAPFEDVFATSLFGVQMDDEGYLQPISLVAVTANVNSFNRVPAFLGRPIEQSDGDFNQPSTGVVVLGYRFWERQYGGDRAIVGKPFKIGKATLRIAGVMPSRYMIGGSADAYVSMSALRVLFPEVIDTGYEAHAKLKPGVTAAQASAAVDPMLHEFARQSPRMFPKEFHAKLQPLLEAFTSHSKVLKNFPMLYLATCALLLIGCANCSLLLLARGTARMHEFALRAAVGASRARIVRQLIVECLLISLLGSALGTALAYVLARLPLQLAADLFPWEAAVRVSLPVLMFSIAVALLAGIGFGLVPALRASRPRIASVLQRQGQRTVVGSGKRSLQALIGVQIALTLILLTVAGAAVAGFRNILQMPLGYDPGNTLAISISYSQTSAKTWQDRLARNESIRQSLEAVPGVRAVTTADDLPPDGHGERPVELIGEASLHQQKARVTLVGVNYFTTLQIPLLQGRTWTEAEARQGLPVAVVNESFARRFSPNRTILNRTVRLPDMAPPPAELQLMNQEVSPAVKRPEVEVVGVVADAVNNGLDKPVMPGIYINSSYWLLSGSMYLVQTAGDPEGYRRPLVLAARRAAGKAYILTYKLTLQEMVEHDPMWRTQRLVAVLLAIFAAFALVLSLVGLYSVVSYAVARRTSEFGIRIALGAQRGQILRLVLRSNFAVVLGGTAAGVLASLLIRARFAQWSHYSSRSPLLILLAALLLVVSALLASLLPARRAAFVQPVEALRAE